MTHHPDEAMLLALAAGTLAPGPALVLAAHLELCGQCRAAKAGLEAVGGALLDELPPAPMTPASFAATLARLDLPAAQPAPAAPSLPAGMPAALQGCVFGRWWWLGPGIRYRRVRLPWAPAENVMLLRVAANRRVLGHSHGGEELTLVLEGSFTDETGAYARGDLQLEDETTLHRPHAGPQGCLCLASLEGGLRLPWWRRAG